MPNITENYTVINNGDCSGSLTSNVFPLRYIYVAALAATFTGSPVGTIKLQGSTDPGNTDINVDITGAGVVNWNDIVNSSQAVTGAGHVTWNYQGIGYRWIRVIYTRSSGTGNVTVIANGKG